MKKIMLPLFVMTFAMSSFTSSSNNLTPSENEGEIDCAEFAWNAATVWCANRGGCTEYQEWAFTSIAYDECMASQEE